MFTVALVVTALNAFLCGGAAVEGHEGRTVEWLLFTVAWGAIAHWQYRRQRDRPCLHLHRDVEQRR